MLTLMACPIQQTQLQTLSAHSGKIFTINLTVKQAEYLNKLLPQKISLQLLQLNNQNNSTQNETKKKGRPRKKSRTIKFTQKSKKKSLRNSGQKYHERGSQQKQQYQVKKFLDQTHLAVYDDEKIIKAIQDEVKKFKCGKKEGKRKFLNYLIVHMLQQLLEIPLVKKQYEKQFKQATQKCEGFIFNNYSEFQNWMRKVMKQKSQKIYTPSKIAIRQVIAYIRQKRYKKIIQDQSQSNYSKNEQKPDTGSQSGNKIKNKKRNRKNEEQNISRMMIQFQAYQIRKLFGSLRMDQKKRLLNDLLLQDYSIEHLMTWSKKRYYQIKKAILQQIKLRGKSQSDVPNYKMEDEQSSPDINQYDPF